MFLNRARELKILEDLVQESHLSSTTLSVYNARSASGFTAFLKFAYQKYQRSDDIMVFYIDGNNKIQNSVVSQIIVNLRKSYPDAGKLLQEYINDKYNVSKNRNAFASLAEGIPYAGPYFKNIIESDDAIPIHNSAYASLVAEFISPFLRELSKTREIIFFVDNLQEIDEWSLDVLRTTIGRPYKKFKYFLGLINRKNDKLTEENILIKMRSLGYDMNLLKFEPPSAGLIWEICEYDNIQLSRSEIKSLIKRNRGNIYKILAEVRNIICKRKVDLTPVQREIVGLLHTSRQSLRESDIITILFNSGSVFIDSLQEFREEFDALIDNGIIDVLSLPDSDNLVELIQSSSPMASDYDAAIADTLFYASTLYDYFVRVEKEATRHSKSEVALLLYRLSKIVDKKNVGYRGKIILSLSLKMGSIQAAENFVEKAIFDSRLDMFEDYMIKIAFYLSTRCYREALTLLNDPKYSQWQGDRYISVFKAITLNRCRLHSESSGLIRYLLATSLHKEEKVILLSFLISGALHENHVTEARAIFNEFKDELKEATNYGYFLRNGASSFESSDTEIILLEAIKHFEETADTFGYYSTLANLGQCQCRLNKVSSGQEKLLRAYENLEVFGIHHLHIVLNNLGICKIMLRSPFEAENYLKRALVLAYNEMPKIFIKMNLAVLEMINGNCKNGLEAMMGLEKTVDNFIIDRPRQLYYVNMSLMCFVCNESTATISHYCNKAVQHPDRMLPDITYGRVRKIQEYSQNRVKFDVAMIPELFLPCYLAYWYQNPLELLPQKLLSFETVKEN